jgi:hypothetical protein
MIPRLFSRIADAVWDWAWAGTFAILNRASK